VRKPSKKKELFVLGGLKKNTDVIIAVNDKRVEEDIAALLRSEPGFRISCLNRSGTLLNKIEEEPWDCLIASENFDNVNHAGLVQLIRSGVICTPSLPIIIVRNNETAEHEAFDLRFFVTSLPRSRIGSIVETIGNARNRTPRPTVLVIEDDDDYRKQLTSYLRSSYTVYDAANGSDGLDLFDEFDPDIVVTDYRMPVMSGDDLARQIRDRSRDVPIIALTAHDTKNVRVDLTLSGITDFITKRASLSAIERKCTEHFLQRQVDQMAGQKRAASEQKNGLARAMEAARRELRQGRSGIANHRIATALTAFADEETEDD